MITMSKKSSPNLNLNPNDQFTAKFKDLLKKAIKSKACAYCIVTELTMALSAICEHPDFENEEMLAHIIANTHESTPEGVTRH